MLGAIIGDVAGSYFEHFPTKSLDAILFREDSGATDDTVLSLAVADWILNGGQLQHYFHEYVARYPGAGYGGTFINWARCREMEPYDSWGNGSAMRVSPVAYVKDSLEEVLQLAEQTAAVTHNHADGIAGAQATAAAIFMARTGSSKAEIRDFIKSRFDYDLDRKIEEIRPRYSFDVSCAGSVPESIISFLESDSFESAIRIAISLGGDADTMACIAGAIAEPFYGGVPLKLWQTTKSYLDERQLATVNEFSTRFSTLPDPVNVELESSNRNGSTMKIELHLGDITQLSVDAIVNAANESLLGGGGVDGAIHAAAGPQLLEASRALAPCPAGEARLTAGFQLQARYVIHTVGPIYRDGNRDEAAILQRAYESSLRIACDNGLQTIAFPCISTGVYRFPQHQAASIAGDTVKNWLNSNPLPTQITFCCFAPDDLAIYQDLLGRNDEGESKANMLF